MTGPVPTQIVLSSLLWDAPQTDGRFVIREQHTDDLGNSYTLDYMATPDMDLQARLVIHAEQYTAQFGGA